MISGKNKEITMVVLADNKEKTMTMGSLSSFPNLPALADAKTNKVLTISSEIPKENKSIFSTKTGLP